MNTKRSLTAVALAVVLSCGPETATTRDDAQASTVSPASITSAADVVLSNGVAATGLSGAKGGQAFYRLDVPAGATNLKFTISGGTGDVDLYTRFGSHPTLTAYDCRPYIAGNAESCSVAAPSAGSYFVLLNGYAAYSGVTLVATFTAATGTGGGAGGGTGTGGGTATGGGSATGGGTGGGVVRVLFDAAHNQVVGNANWVLDADFPSPVPANPTTETSWSGGISAFGFDLVKTGHYVVAQLPSGNSLNWGQGGNGDLQNFDVFVSDEPELKFTSAEQAALMQFVNAGKGIFLVSDHSGAKRCTGCTEAWQVINDFVVTGAGSGFGVKVDGNSKSPTGTASDARVSSGPFGQGTTMNFHSGSTVSTTGGNANAAVFVGSSSGALMVGSQLGAGRIVLLGDSSPVDDGTCQCSASLFNGWAEVNDAVLILNATAWLAHQ